MIQMKALIDRALSSIMRNPSISEEITPYGQMYPWQLSTRLSNIPMSARLPFTFPVDRMQEDLSVVLKHYPPKEQFGPYHLGGWQGVALHAIGGNALEDRHVPGGDYRKTDALKLAPTLEAIVDSFPCQKHRVRLLYLAPGKKIFWHCDPWCASDLEEIRLHIPIVTNPAVDVQISHENLHWRAGELWYGDFSFPHRLQNGGATGRIHLVMDLIANEAIRAMLPKDLLQATDSRAKARARAAMLLGMWDRLFRTRSQIAQRRVA